MILLYLNKKKLTYDDRFLSRNIIWKIKKNWKFFFYFKWNPVVIGNSNVKLSWWSNCSNIYPASRAFGPLSFTYNRNLNKICIINKIIFLLVLFKIKNYNLILTNILWKSYFVSPNVLTIKLSTGHEAISILEIDFSIN